MEPAVERFFDRWLTLAIAMARWQSLMKRARLLLVVANPNTTRFVVDARACD